MNRSAGLPARRVGNGHRRTVPEAGAPIARFMGGISRSKWNTELSMIWLSRRPAGPTRRKTLTAARMDAEDNGTDPAQAQFTLKNEPCYGLTPFLG